MQTVIAVIQVSFSFVSNNLEIAFTSDKGPFHRTGWATVWRIYVSAPLPAPNFWVTSILSLLWRIVIIGITLKLCTHVAIMLWRVKDQLLTSITITFVGVQGSSQGSRPLFPWKTRVDWWLLTIIPALKVVIVVFRVGNDDWKADYKAVSFLTNCSVTERACCSS